jgi:hypothetical protein
MKENIVPALQNRGAAQGGPIWRPRRSARSFSDAGPRVNGGRGSRARPYSKADWECRVDHGAEELPVSRASRMNLGFLEQQDLR